MNNLNRVVLSVFFFCELLSLNPGIANIFHLPFYTSTLSAIPLPVSWSITSFITVSFVIIFLYTKPHFLLVEIDSSDDTKQFISPFIPCFLLIAPPPEPHSLPCVSGGEREEIVVRLIGFCANYWNLWLSGWQIWLCVAVKY